MSKVDREINEQCDPTRRSDDGQRISPRRRSRTVDTLVFEFELLNQAPAKALNVARVIELNEGRRASMTLMEVISVDQGALLTALLPNLSGHDGLGSSRLLERMEAGAQLLWAEFGDELWLVSDRWVSDVARGWAAMAVGVAPGLTLSQRLRRARKFAEDPHWAVREWAWLGVRKHIVAQPHVALKSLRTWATSASPLARRFASESTRPIGVWSKHIQAFRADPSPALPLLSALCDDPSRYVRLSVGNWLNDASKTNPAWVSKVCSDWPDTPNCDHIRRRALRTMRVSELKAIPKAGSSPSAPQGASST